MALVSITGVAYFGYDSVVRFSWRLALAFGFIEIGEIYIEDFVKRIRGRKFR